LAILGNNGKATPYRLKTKLPDGAILFAIARNRVELRYPNGQTRVLELIPNKQQTNQQQKSRPTRARKGQQQIENLGQNRWLIPIQVAENARTNIGGLLRQAQAVPYLENGRTTGFQIRMIQPGTLIAQLGLKKGDILREINGLPLNSPEKALQIFGQLRQAKQVSIGLERRGKAMTFAYEIK
jgi:general secretion pathway protein C